MGNNLEFRESEMGNNLDLEKLRFIEGHLQDVIDIKGKTPKDCYEVIFSRLAELANKYHESNKEYIPVFIHSGKYLLQLLDVEGSEVKYDEIKYGSYRFIVFKDEKLENNKFLLSFEEQIIEIKIQI